MQIIRLRLAVLMLDRSSHGEGRTATGDGWGLTGRRAESHVTAPAGSSRLSWLSWLARPWVLPPLAAHPRQEDEEGEQGEEGAATSLAERCLLLIEDFWLPALSRTGRLAGLAALTLFQRCGSGYNGLRGFRRQVSSDTALNRARRRTYSSLPAFCRGDS